MNQQRYIPEQKQVIDEILGGVTGVSERKTFGHPAYYIRGKMFATMMETGVALKLPEDTVAELVAQGHQPLSHGGPPVRGWVVLTVPDAAQLRDCTPLIEQSVGYVSSQVAAG
ncbi:TfoX/Sxy family protein [Aggregatilinea lenta]|uniref:TfoX/Sxy family protein n=1 Tax=Aggregatilinea lenta TaxID=913108 RepID=UPI000E5AE5B7|nr:TfoX/Sxy family protein [Aggregatilinea lenta]